MTEQEAQAYTRAFVKASKSTNKVAAVEGVKDTYIVDSSDGGHTDSVTLGAAKTLVEATCECDVAFPHISCYHRALAFNYYVDTLLPAKLDRGMETIYQYEAAGLDPDFIDNKTELWKAQVAKYEDLCKWRKQFISTSPVKKLKAVTAKS